MPFSITRTVARDFSSFGLSGIWRLVGCLCNGPQPVPHHNDPLSPGRAPLVWQAPFGRGSPPCQHPSLTKRQQGWGRFTQLHLHGRPVERVPRQHDPCRPGGQLRRDDEDDRFRGGILQPGENPVDLDTQARTRQLRRHERGRGRSIQPRYRSTAQVLPVDHRQAVRSQFAGFAAAEVQDGRLAVDRRRLARGSAAKTAHAASAGRARRASRRIRLHATERPARVSIPPGAGAG